MDNKNIDIKLSELANGAVQEKLSYEIKKVFNNIHDPNTPAEAKRHVNIKIVFQPDENRQTVKVDTDLTTKLADVQGVSTTILTGRDLDTGIIEARELKSGTPGQMYFDENGTTKSDVGDPIKDGNGNIIDLQKGR